MNARFNDYTRENASFFSVIPNCLYTKNVDFLEYVRNIIILSRCIENYLDF